MNAIIYAQSKFEDSILYTTMSPCKACLKIISATKIKKVIYKNKYKDLKESLELAKIFNIELIEFNDDLLCLL
jgi:dCMP deaminase